MDPKTVLLIEDDTMVADMYAYELKTHGYQVLVVPDGASGINEAKNKHYDILLVDLMIPKPDGTEVIRQLRGADGKGLANSKVVVLTNVILEDKEMAKLKPLIDKYLVKANTVPSKLIEELNSL
jgi:DNA-binding response OmpR family regulator